MKNAHVGSIAESFKIPVREDAPSTIPGELVGISRAGRAKKTPKRSHLLCFSQHFVAPELKCGRGPQQADYTWLGAQ